MNRWKTTSFLFLAVTLLIPVSAQQQQRVLDYSRDNVRRAEAPKITRQKLPDTLVLARREGRVAVAPNRDGSRPVNLEGRAHAAAAWAANHLARDYGYREYYQVGFYKALQHALNTQHD